MPLGRFIFGLGIRHVGKGTSDALAAEFLSFSALWQYLQKCRDAGPEEKAGLLLGLARTKKAGNISISGNAVISLLRAVNNEALVSHVEDLLAEVTVISSAPAEERVDQQTGSGGGMVAHELSGKSVAFTGKMLRLRRSEAESVCRSLGGIPVSTVTSSCCLVVRGDGSGDKGSSKLSKAMKLGLPILSEDDWLRLTAGDQDREMPAGQ